MVVCGGGKFPLSPHTIHVRFQLASAAANLYGLALMIVKVDAIKEPLTDSKGHANHFARQPWVLWVLIGLSSLEIPLNLVCAVFAVLCRRYFRRKATYLSEERGISQLARMSAFYVGWVPPGPGGQQEGPRQNSLMGPMAFMNAGAHRQTLPRGSGQRPPGRHRHQHPRHGMNTTVL